MRILLLLGTAAVGETAALVSNAPQLPGFARAASAAESYGGLRDVLVAAQEVDQVKVAVADGTLHVVLPANVLSMAAQGAPASSSARKKPEVHHIATVENNKSSARGGPWTPRFKDIFDKAGMSMEDPANKVQLQGHTGPHPEAYHSEVYERLRRATKTCQSPLEYRSALLDELGKMALDLAKQDSKLYKLLTQGNPR
jgi:A nuclease family of the HNH/ENDO VII superfamily with conserved AHH